MLLFIIYIYFILNHESGYLPILDTEMKVESGRIVFRHYSKPMSSLEVVNSRSAMSTGSQISILVQEASRILRNCELSLPWNEKLFFLNKLMIRMMWSGHNQTVREIVARRSLARYFTNIRNFRETGRPLYRSVEQRRNVLKMDKATWFRKEGATATLMVPWTPNSSLARMLRQVVKDYQGPRGTSVKVTEKPGLAVMSMVQGKKRFRRPSCGRTKCPLSSAGQDCFDACYQEGIIYTGRCRICEENGTQSVYIGESSRTLFTRTNQHLRDLKRTISRPRTESGNAEEREELSSWIKDHFDEKHSDMEISGDGNQIYFSVISSHPDPFLRQTVEAVRIQDALSKGELKIGKKSEKISSLNRKGEFFAARERWDSRGRL